VSQGYYGVNITASNYNGAVHGRLSDIVSFVNLLGSINAYDGLKTTIDISIAGYAVRTVMGVIGTVTADGNAITVDYGPRSPGIALAASGPYFQAYPSGLGRIGGGVFSEDSPLTLITDARNGYVYKIHGVAYNMTIFGSDEAFKPYGVPSPIGPADYSITNTQTGLIVQNGIFDISIASGHDTYITINNLPNLSSGYPTSIQFTFSQAEGGPDGGGIVTLYRVH
jgi:hypothetical protein